MRVLLAGWFAGRSVGSGQYTDRLLAALRAGAAPGDRFELLRPGHGRSIAAKLAFEQVELPRAARGADLAHVPYWAPPWTCPVPRVVTVHDLIPLILPEYRARAGVRAYTALVARATGRADALIADSSHTAADIARLGLADPARIRVIPLGVEARFRPQAAAEWPEGLPADLPPRFGLYLGGFDRRKNLALLFAAWRRVHAATGIPLLVAGRPPAPGDPLHPEPLDLARAAGLPPEGLRLLGFVDEAAKPALLARAAVFAFPSRYEGFGLPPLEAMASGVPVVVAEASCLPELVGAAALRAGPEELEAWVEALRACLEDAALAERLHTAGPRRAAAYTWAATAEATRALYAELGAG